MPKHTIEYTCCFVEPLRSSTNDRSHRLRRPKESESSVLRTLNREQRLTAAPSAVPHGGDTSHKAPHGLLTRHTAAPQGSAVLPTSPWKPTCPDQLGASPSETEDSRQRSVRSIRRRRSLHQGETLTTGVSSSLSSRLGRLARVGLHGGWSDSQRGSYVASLRLCRMCVVRGRPGARAALHDHHTAIRGRR